MLCQDSLEHALASVLASQMHDTTLHELMLFDTFLECLEDQDIRFGLTLNCGTAALLSLLTLCALSRRPQGCGSA